MLVANGYAPDPRVHKEAKTLIKSGYSVSVLCWDRQRNRREKEVLDGVLIRRFRFLHPKGIVSYFLSGCLFLTTCLLVLIKQGFREQRVIVHCHDFNTLPVGWLLRSLSQRFRLVYDSHENFSALLSTIAPRVVASAARAIERLMLPRVDGLIAANDMILATLQPYSKAQGVAVYNTPPLTVSQLSSNKPDIRRLRNEFGADEFVLLYYGAMIRHRGLFALLDAAVLAERSSLRLSFVLVGEGPLTSALRSEVRKRKLDHMVRFYPHVTFERAMVMVKAADAVYIGFEPEDPNNHFASPNKLFESMAMGTPVLTCSFGLLGNLVRMFRCGVTLKSVTGPSILTGVRELEQEGLRKQCSRNGVHWFRSHYNWDTMEERLRETYKVALNLDT